MDKNKLNRREKNKSESRNIFSYCCGFGSNRSDETSDEIRLNKSYNVKNLKSPLNIKPVKSKSECRNNIEENTITKSEFHYFSEGEKFTHHPKSKLTLENRPNSYFYTNSKETDKSENKDLVKNILTKYLEMRRAENKTTETEIINLKNVRLENDFSSESATDDSMFNLHDSEKNCKSCLFSSTKEKRNLEVVFTHSNESLLASPLIKAEEPPSSLESDELSLQYKISCDGTPSVIGSLSAEKLLHHNKNRMNITPVPSQELYIITPPSKGDLLRRKESGASLKWKLVISNHGGKSPK